MQAALHTAAAIPEALSSLAVPWPTLVGQRGYLVQYARRRLLDPALAEDLVHDVFEAVASGRALRSWLVGILKHKIVDLVRQRSGLDSLDAGPGDDGDDSAVMQLTCPQPRPDEVAEQRQRLHRMLADIATLPDTLRDAVELRMLQDRESADVSRALSITEQNWFARLHRARRVLAH